MGKRYAAIVLSAGKGARMNSDVPKQYLMLDDKPVLYYSLHTFQQSRVEDIILVSGREDIAYCQDEIVEKYHFTKVRAVVPGGRERYHSVYCGLRELEKLHQAPDYVMIHDGARPFVSQAIIERCADAVEQSQACVAGMPVKDTIKIADDKGFSEQTPERAKVWQIQTPQTFFYPLILKAYEKILREQPQGITDDAMAVEYGNFAKVKLIQGSYENIKITTPEDMKIAELFLKKVVDK